MQKTIVTIGGGSGQADLLRALYDIDCEVGAVVTMTDNGGSSGKMREEDGILPPGDIRQCISVLSSNRDLWSQWNERSSDNTAAGNIEMRKLFLRLGVEDGIRKAHELFDVQGTVAPVTVADVQLTAVLDDGSVIVGEERIDHLSQEVDARIVSLAVDGPAVIAESARELIAHADMIVLSMGSIYTSLIANLVVDGVGTAIRNAGVPVVLICNRSNGEDSHGFNQADYIQTVEKYLGAGVVTHMILDDGTHPYPEGANIVEAAEITVPGLEVIRADIALEENTAAASGKKVAIILENICNSL